MNLKYTAGGGDRSRQLAGKYVLLLLRVVVVAWFAGCGVSGRPNLDTCERDRFCLDAWVDILSSLSSDFS